MKSKARIDAKLPRTTIGIRRTTKERLDHFRAPGQSRNGFVTELLNMWEMLEEGRYTMRGTKGGGQQNRK